MSYIGNTSTTQAFTPAVDYFSGNASTTAFTLSKTIASVAQVQVTVANVPQNPSSAYTISGQTLTFTSAPPSGTNNIYVYYTSPITQTFAPAQGTVGLTSLNATGTASSSTYLRGDNSWASVSVSPGGSTTQLQYNNAGAFGGISGVTTDGTRMTVSTTMGVGGATPSTSGSGITFPATQSASSDANTLDDYEEGTWTPKNSSAGNLSINNSATYIKIGKLVFINCDINQLNESVVYNLPFTCANTGYPGSVLCGYNSYSSQPITGVFNGNATTLNLYYGGSNNIAPTNNRFVLAGCYVASA
jgi:hypothetical protein